MSSSTTSQVLLQDWLWHVRHTSLFWYRLNALLFIQAWDRLRWLPANQQCGDLNQGVSTAPSFEAASGFVCMHWSLVHPLITTLNNYFQPEPNLLQATWLTFFFLQYLVVNTPLRVGNGITATLGDKLPLAIGLWLAPRGTRRWWTTNISEMRDEHVEEGREQVEPDSMLMMSGISYVLHFLTSTSWIARIPRIRRDRVRSDFSFKCMNWCVQVP